MNIRNRNRQQVCVRISKEALNILDSMAAAHNRNRSNMLETLLESTAQETEGVHNAEEPDT